MGDYIMIKQLIAVFGLGLTSLTANASQLVHLHVEQKADVYNVYVEMTIDAPAERVREILTDYERLERLSQSITSSKVINSTGDESVRVLTRFVKCVLFFCVDLQKVEDISEDRDGRIIVAMVPDASSFRSGKASWEVQSIGNGSRVIHHAKLEPDIGLPAWMAGAIMKNTLRQEIQQSFEKLECLSRTDCHQQPEVIQEPEHDWDDDIWNS